MIAYGLHFAGLNYLGITEAVFMKLILVAILFCSQYSMAASMPALMPTDTSIHPQANAITQEAFLAKYGRDDSSKALINFFFQKMKKSEGMVTGGLLLGAAGTAGYLVGAHKANDQSNSFSDELGYVVLALLGAFALGGGIALASVGTGLLSRYSKKRLLKLLESYFAGTPIPRGIARNIMFRSYVQFGEWNSEIRKQIKAADRERKRQK